MKIYIIDKKSNWTGDKISELEKYGKVIFIDDEKPDLSKMLTIDNDEKIIAPVPEPFDWKFPNDLIEKIPNLKAICLPTTGFDWVDGKKCSDLNIKLTNAPHYSTNSVAEYAIFLMFCLSRKLPLQIKNDFKLSYSQDMLLEEIKGKTMGIIGLGHIGKRIAELGEKLGMKIIYWSKRRKEVPFEYKELENVISEADFVFPALALNKETEGILSSNLLQKMKKTAYFVSIINKEVYDRKFLIEQIKDEKIAGLAFEDGKEDLRNYEGNIMITAPYAWYTKEAFKNNLNIWVKTIISVCEGEAINVVN